jgi:transcriptional regulator with XRE-family HTH domain
MVMNTSTSNYAKKIEDARKRAGKSVNEMAHILGISVPAYYDLETYDDEITGSLSLKNVALLLATLGVDPEDFFDIALEKEPVISKGDLVERIKDYVSLYKISLSEFDERAGWEVEKIVEDPSRIVEYNIDGLQDISALLGVNWMAVFLGATRNN